MGIHLVWRSFWKSVYWKNQAFQPISSSTNLSFFFFFFFILVFCDWWSWINKKLMWIFNYHKKSCPRKTLRKRITNWHSYINLAWVHIKSSEFEFYFRNSFFIFNEKFCVSVSLTKKKFRPTYKGSVKVLINLSFLNNKYFNRVRTRGGPLYHLYNLRCCFYLFPSYLITLLKCIENHIL
jgi:hypothetical protein